MGEALATCRAASAVFSLFHTVFLIAPKTMSLNNLFAILNGMVRTLSETTDKAQQVEIRVSSLRIQGPEMASRAIKKARGSWIGFNLRIKDHLASRVREPEV